MAGSLLPSSARSLIARNTDQGQPRRSHTAATAEVSMSIAMAPARASSPITWRSVTNFPDVTRVPRAVSLPSRAGRCSAPLSRSSTRSGTTRSPIATEGPMPPATPTTTTQPIPPGASTRSVASAAAAVPMPVVVATMSMPPSAPVHSAPPGSLRRSDSGRTSGRSSGCMGARTATRAPVCTAPSVPRATTRSPCAEPLRPASPTADRR